MRYEHLEQIRVDVKVLTPLHIGGGKQNNLRKKLLLYNTVSKTVSVPDLPKMIDYMEQNHHLSDFEAYLLGGNEDMYQFLRGVRISTQEARRFMAYTLACTEPVNQVNELNVFIKDSAGMPYIPGSSLKGAVRTALLAQRMDDAACGILRQEAEENPRMSRASAVEGLLRTLPGSNNSMLQDILRGIAFSDCESFGSEDMIVCRKQWQKANGEVKANALFLECVKPGVTTSFRLTIDHRILPEACFPHALESIQAALAAWHALNLARYDSCYPEPLPSEVKSCTGSVLRLGAGTGLQAKSLLTCLPDQSRRITIENMLIARHRTNYKPHLSFAPAPYCRKVTVFGQRVLPFGYCGLTFRY